MFDIIENILYFSVFVLFESVICWTVQWIFSSSVIEMIAVVMGLESLLKIVD